MISFFFCCLAILVIVLRNVSLRHPKQSEGDELGNAWKIRELRRFNGRHEAASILLELLEKDGAGAWPPKANHDSWPPALCPYKDIYLELVPLLPTAEPSLDDNVNRERINHFRLLMQKSLKERIDIAEVKEILAAVEAGNEVVLPRDAYNGFYGCVAVCRHAYRYVHAFLEDKN